MKVVPLYLAIVVLCVTVSCGDDSTAGDPDSGTPNPDASQPVECDAPLNVQTGDEGDWVVSAVAENSAFDNIRPMAVSVYHLAANTTFATYLGGVSEETAGIYVLSYDHTTQTQTQPRELYNFSTADIGSTFDGHSYPQVVQTLDGHVHVFFCDQRGDHNNVHIRFNEPGTVLSDFTTEVLLYGGDGLHGYAGDSAIRAEYPKAIVARDGSLYYFTRGVRSNEPELVIGGESRRIAHRSQLYVKSTDHGLTWEPAREAIDRWNDQDLLTEPYLTQVVAAPDRPGEAQQFHFVWTLAAGATVIDDGSGTLEYNYHNAYAKNVYHAYFVPGSDTFYSVSGEDLGETIDGAEMDAHCLVVESGFIDAPTPPLTPEQMLDVTGRCLHLPDLDHTAQTTGCTDYDYADIDSVSGRYDGVLICPADADRRACAITLGAPSIMGNVVSVDDQGVVTVNGRHQWSGTAWEPQGEGFPADTRSAEWRDGAHYAYHGLGAETSAEAYGPWTVVGSMSPDGLVDEALIAAGTSERAFPTTAPAHPAARLWAKQYSAEEFVGYLLLGGHLSSYTPQLLRVTLDEGTASPGDEVQVTAFICDEWGARIMNACDTVDFEADLAGTFSATSVDAAEGAATATLTVGADTPAGEYPVTVSSGGLTVGIAYLTVQ